jgi:hypothetical protein
MGECACVETLLPAILIPASVKRLGNFIFLNCHDLQTGLFEKDSTLQEINGTRFLGPGWNGADIPASIPILAKHSFPDSLRLNPFDLSCA